MSRCSECPPREPFCACASSQHLRKFRMASTGPAGTHHTDRQELQIIFPSDSSSDKTVFWMRPSDIHLCVQSSINSRHLPGKNNETPSKFSQKIKFVSGYQPFVSKRANKVIFSDNVNFNFSKIFSVLFASSLVY